MFFSYPEDFKKKNVLPGIELKLVWGEKIMLSYATFEPNCILPAHRHSNEQVGMVIEGEMELTIGGETQLCRKGDAFAIPGDVEHSVFNGDTHTVVVDTFSPPREDYK